MKKQSVFLIGLSALLLAGCGGSTTTVSEQENTGATNTGASQNEDIDSATVGGDKEIVFWHCLGHDKTRNFNIIVDKFNEDHKNTDGFTIKPEHIAGDYDSLHDAVKTKLNAGFTPSITMGYPDSFSEYMGSQGADKSKIINLSNYISTDTTFNPADFVDDYYNEGTGYQYEGTWSVPLYKSTEVMYYNKEMFESTTFYKENATKTYGSYGAVLGQPTTWDWDTLTYVATQIQSEYNAKTGKDRIADFHAVGYDSDSNLFISQMAQRGIPYTTNAAEGAARYEFYSPAGQAGLKALGIEIYNLTQAGAMVTKASYGSYASDLFLSKKVMFTIGSTGGSTYNQPTDNSFTCMISKVPSYHNNAKYIMQGPSLCFFNTSNPAKEKAAWEFYSKYVSDVDLNTALALENSYDPVKKAAYDSKNYKQWIALGQDETGQEDPEALLAYRIPMLTATLKDNYMTTPVFNGSGTARNEIGRLITYAKQESGTTEEKVTAAIRQIFLNCTK